MKACLSQDIQLEKIEDLEVKDMSFSPNLRQLLSLLWL